MNYREKKLGYNAAHELLQRLVPRFFAMVDQAGKACVYASAS